MVESRSCPCFVRCFFLSSDVGRNLRKSLSEGEDFLLRPTLFSTYGKDNAFAEGTKLLQKGGAPGYPACMI